MGYNEASSEGHSVAKSPHLQPNVSARVGVEYEVALNDDQPQTGRRDIQHYRSSSRDEDGIVEGRRGISTPGAAAGPQIGVLVRELGPTTAVVRKAAVLVEDIDGERTEGGWRRRCAGPEGKEMDPTRGGIMILTFGLIEP